MPELKRTFSKAIMNKDVDDRLVPPGQHRDANNIEISTSEGSNVGTVQTIRGNTQYNTMLSSSGVYGVPANATCVASIAAVDKDKIYYFVSGGDKSNSTGYEDLRKDYILEYDSVRERHRYVFVDIYSVKTTVSTAVTGTAQGYILIDAATTTNTTGVRVGMEVEGTFNSVVYEEGDGLKVKKIEYVAGTTDWKIHLSKDGVDFSSLSAALTSVTFRAPRVLWFKKDILITGINILDNFIYWTDNTREPKKINIPRCIAGTGGSSEAFGTFDNTYSGDTDHFHTRLTKAKIEVEGGDDTYVVVTMHGPEGYPVYVAESNVTVIKKAPTQPLELDMYRSSISRVNEQGIENPSFINQTSHAYVGDNGAVLDAGASGHVLTGINEVDFRAGDKILAFSDQTTSGQEVGNHGIRMEVTSSPVTDANTLGDGNGIVVKILSISSSVIASHTEWTLKLESPGVLFEYKFPRFSYRYKYQDGEYSTFAPWSQVAFLPDTFSYQAKKGYNFGMVNQLRGLTLKNYHPRGVSFSDSLAGSAIPTDVLEIDILYKETGKPTVYTVKTLKPSDGHPIWPDLTSSTAPRGEFNITTDMIHAVVASNQLLRPWDNVPRKALAQEISANRLIYGNYLQNYTVPKDPVIEVGLDSTSGFSDTAEDAYACPSVKSMRKYQVGVVFSDEYGRETPVLTTKNASYTVPKDASATKNRLKCKLNEDNEIPSWAKYFSYYVKETSIEYYTLSQDRWYNAADGNIWISFPSSERNKVDIDTFIKLKKEHGDSGPVFDKTRYKILAIESNAPDFIKKEKINLGTLVNASVEENVLGNGSQGYPLQDFNFVLVLKTQFEESIVNVVDITGDTVVRFSGQGQMAEYDVTNITVPDDAPMSGEYVRIDILGSFGSEIDWISTDDTSGNIVGDVSITLFETNIKNRPEFDGRFFVKIFKDATLENSILNSPSAPSFISDSTPLRYINNNGWKTHVGEHTPSNLQHLEGHANPSSDQSYYYASLEIDHNDAFDYQTVLNEAGDVGSYPTRPAEGEYQDLYNKARHPTEYRHHTDQSSDTNVNFYNKYGQGEDVYYWGGGTYNASGAMVGTDPSFFGGASTDEVRGNPIIALNVNLLNQKATNYWWNISLVGGFFIDACGAYSWTGESHDVRGPNSSDIYDEGNWMGGNTQSQMYIGFNNEGGGGDLPTNTTNTYVGRWTKVQDSSNQFGTPEWEHGSYDANGTFVSSDTPLYPSEWAWLGYPYAGYFTAARVVLDEASLPWEEGLSSDGVVVPAGKYGGKQGARNVRTARPGNEYNSLYGNSTFFEFDAEANTPKEKPRLRRPDSDDHPDAYGAVQGGDYGGWDGWGWGWGPGYNKYLQRDLWEGPYSYKQRSHSVSAVRKVYYNGPTVTDKGPFFVTSGVSDVWGDGNQGAMATPSLFTYEATTGWYSNTAYDDWKQRKWINEFVVFGQPSRGIWGDDNQYIDISWSGMRGGVQVLGHWQNLFNENGAQTTRIPGRLKDTDLEQTFPGASLNGLVAYNFINKLTQPNTKFKFAQDPDNTVYTVLAEHHSPRGYDDEIYKSTTNKQTGVYGIRNMLDRGTTSDNYSWKAQHLERNHRQRWTLVVSPGVGSGPSGYNPIRGTKSPLEGGPSVGEDNYRRAVNHDFSPENLPPEAIHILEPMINDYGVTTFTSNPGVWETEPKESVDLDIYYQASGLIPLELNSITNEEYIPIGSTFKAGESSGDVLAWNNQTITVSTPDIQESDFVGGSVVTFTKRNHYSLTAVVESYDQTTGLLKLRGGPSTTDTADRLFSQTHHLDWNNCWSFGNGVESDRVRDDYNAPQMDNGVKASTVLADQTREERRKHGLIWSGIYNSTSGINNTNQFIMAEPITKDLNPVYGSIQSLLNRNTRLIMFCEDKILRADTNKDLLFNADGNSQVVASNKVIGSSQAYQGDFGIGTNPESIAVTPYNVYFTDAMRGKVLSLTTEGITPISDKGLKNYFADKTSKYVWRALGTYDERKNEYNLSILKKSTPTQIGYNDDTFTASYSERAKGWVSFKSFYPQHGVSINNQYYTFYNGGIWKHHVDKTATGLVDVPRNNFYGTQYSSDITVLFNDSPAEIKTFATIGYEGSEAKVSEFDTGSTLLFNNVWEDGSPGNGLDAANITDGEYYNLEASAGWYADNITTNLQACGSVEFKNKEGKYFGYPIGEATTLDNLDEEEFTVQGLGLANITHSDSSVDNVITVKVENNSGIGAFDSIQELQQEQSRWSVSTNSFLQTSEATITLWGGEAPSLELQVSPNLANGVNYFPLSAANLIIEGADKVGNVYTVTANTNVSGAGVNWYDVDTITLSDEGTAGDSLNTVKVVVKFKVGQAWPTASSTYIIDIDDVAGVSDLGDVDVKLLTTYAIPRRPGNNSISSQLNPLKTGSIYANAAASYNSDYPGVAGLVTSDLSSLTEFRELVVNGIHPTPGSYQNTFEGTAPQGETTLISEFVFETSLADVTYGSISGNGWPWVQFENMADYAPYYTYEIQPVAYIAGVLLKKFNVRIYYTPPSPAVAVNLEEPQGTPKATIRYSQFIYVEPNGGDTHIGMTSIDYSKSMKAAGGQNTINVKGEIGANYKISVQKKENKTSVNTVSTRGYYNFSEGRFQTDLIEETARLDGSGKMSHYLTIPAASEDTRYDITINPMVNGKSITMSDSVPRIAGEASIIQYGVKSITLTPTSLTEPDCYGTIPTVTINRPSLFTGRGGNSSSLITESTTAIGGTAGSSTRLVLKSINNNIKTGMYVFSAFNMQASTSSTLIIPMGTTVVSVNKKVVTLSAACTIAADTNLNMVTNNAAVIQYSIQVPPASGKVISLETSAVDFEAAAGGDARATLDLFVHAGVSNTNPIQVALTAGAASPAHLTATGISQTIVPGMEVRGGESFKVGGGGGQDYAVVTELNTGVANLGQMIVQPSIAARAGTPLYFSYPTDNTTTEVDGSNTNVKQLHMQTSMAGTNLKIEGYVNVDSINSSEAILIYIDSIADCDDV